VKTLTKPKTLAHIRWMIRRDMPEVLAIEGQSFEFPWSEEDFIHCLRQRNCIGMVAERHERIVGYMIYELHPSKLHILNFCASPKGEGIGATMVDKLKSKLCQTRRNKIMAEVRESNLDACLFFKAMGFKAISVHRDYYEDSPEDMYMFRYRYRAGDSA